MSDRRSDGLSDRDWALLATLSESLRPIYDFERILGNQVVRVDDRAWTTCTLAVVFERPLHRQLIEAELKLPPSVVSWDCTDPHYALESGYYCRATQHSVAGPRP